MKSDWELCKGTGTCECAWDMRAQGAGRLAAGGQRAAAVCSGSSHRMAPSSDRRSISGST